MQKLRISADLSLPVDLATSTAGYIDYPQTGLVKLTSIGHQAAVPLEDVNSSEDVQKMLLAKLPPAKRKIVEVVIAAHPEPMSREHLAAEAGASGSSSSFNNNLSALHTAQIVDYPERGLVKASEHLFI